MGYSWYFYDSHEDHYHIDAQPAIAYVKSFIQSQNLAHKKIIAIGYSQGEYLLAHLINHIDSIRHAIGIGCQFKVDTITSGNLKSLWAIHGELDLVVNPQLAKQHLEKLNIKRKGYIEVKNSGHEIDLAIKSQLKDLVASIII